VTLMIHRDGALKSPSIRVPLWAARTLLLFGSALAVAVVLGTVTHGPVVRLAARVPLLEREIERLQAENAQVRDLAARLGELESRYEQVRSMLGGDLIPRRAQGDSLAVAHPVLARAPDAPQHYELGPSPPRHWPLDEAGVVTRGQVSMGTGREAHPGLDIAVPTGTPIRAAGGGIVTETGDDVEYGRFALIEHPDGYQTLYGHASRLLVVAGEAVNAGQVIGLSGSTGRSTAPHLHFEARQGGKAIDPRPLLGQAPS
jgi:murein DD-endopeptidase MepM/ murein hydrolase activator NlpD